MRGRMPAPAAGSKVSQISMRAYRAMKRQCEHGFEEFRCHLCLLNHPKEMGWIPTLVVEQSQNPKLKYTEWGRGSLIVDLFTDKGVRQSNFLRAIGVGELGMDLADVIVDFYPDDRDFVTVYRGAWAEQFWIRLPARLESHTNESQWVRELAWGYEQVLRGRKKLWKRKQKMKIEAVEMVTA